MVDVINKDQGFRIKGWFKPALTENEVVTEEFVFHVCYFHPDADLSTFQQGFRYGVPGGSVAQFCFWD